MIVPRSASWPLIGFVAHKCVSEWNAHAVDDPQTWEIVSDHTKCLTTHAIGAPSRVTTIPTEFLEVCFNFFGREEAQPAIVHTYSSPDTHNIAHCLGLFPLYTHPSVMMSLPFGYDTRLGTRVDIVHAQLRVHTTLAVTVAQVLLFLWSVLQVQPVVMFIRSVLSMCLIFQHHHTRFLMSATVLHPGSTRNLRFSHNSSLNPHHASWSRTSLRRTYFSSSRHIHKQHHVSAIFFCTFSSAIIQQNQLLVVTVTASPCLDSRKIDVSVNSAAVSTGHGRLMCDTRLSCLSTSLVHDFTAALPMTGMTLSSYQNWKEQLCMCCILLQIQIPTSSVCAVAHQSSAAHCGTTSLDQLFTPESMLTEREVTSKRHVCEEDDSWTSLPSRSFDGELDSPLLHCMLMARNV